MTALTLEVVRFASVLPQPWRNGGGQTRELFVLPGSGTSFNCRISIADIDRPCAFSRFEGIDRTLVVIEGEGVDIAIGPQISRLGHLQAASFQGEVAVGAIPVGGPSRDFNVMTRRGRFRHSLRLVAPDTRFVIDAEMWAFLGLSDRCKAFVGTRRLTLGRLDLLAATSSAHDFSADGPGLLVEIFRV